MVHNLSEVNRQLPAQSQTSIENGLAIEPPEHYLFLLIEPINFEPHPLGLSRVFVLEFDLYMVATPILLSLASPTSADCTIGCYSFDAHVSRARFGEGVHRFGKVT